jgi:hypothetical protein
MGCGSSSSATMQRIVAGFFDELSEMYEELYEVDLPPLFVSLEDYLTPPPADAELIIAHLRHIRDTGDLQLLGIAAQIILEVKKNWLLDLKTLRFFKELWLKSHEKFSSLLTMLSSYCKINELGLTADHLDTVINSLYRDSLPEDAWAVIESYVTAKPGFEESIYRLRLTHRPHLSETATIRHLSHHDIPHALEIRERAAHILQRVLGLFNSTHARDHFLREVALFMVEFHDYIQGDKGAHKSVELATAACVVDWLTESMELHTNPKLKKIIEFMANQIIVLGTTMVFSKKQTTDLLELFLRIKDIAIETRLITSPCPDLTKLVELIALVTGVCDKNPTAFLAIAGFHAEVATLPRVRRYSLPSGEIGDDTTAGAGAGAASSTRSALMVIEEFLASSDFHPYIESGRGPLELNKQLLLAMLVPHLSMSAELAERTNPHYSHAYTRFIHECRVQMEKLSEPDFKAWFRREFQTREIATVIKELFFANIAREMEFSRSQIGGLRFVRERLGHLVSTLLGFDAARASLIDPSVPETDARNLAALKTFYDRLEPTKQNLLLQELILVVIMQAGTKYKAALPTLTFSSVTIGGTGTVETASTATPVALGLFRPTPRIEEPATLPGSVVGADFNTVI